MVRKSSLSITKLAGFSLSLFISLITVLPIALVSLYGLFMKFLVPVWWKDENFFASCNLELLVLVSVAVIGGGILGLVGGRLLRKSKTVGVACGIVLGLCILGVYILYAIGMGYIILIYNTVGGNIISEIEVVTIGVGTFAYACLVYTIGQKAQK